MNIYWRETGNDKTNSVVFIHGGGMTNDMWTKYTVALKDFHCIILDLPGHGKSIDLKPFTINRSVEEIAELIRLKAHGGRAHVIGHSIGGIILVQLLTKYSGLVRHSIVASANLIPTYIYKFLGSKLICSCMSLAVRKNKKFNFITTELLMKLNMEIIIHSNIPKELSKIVNPVLFLCGEKEIGSIKLSVKNSVKIIPNSKGVLIKKANHNFPFKKTDLFIEVINDWIINGIISNELVELK